MYKRQLHQLALNTGYVEKSLRYLHALQLMVLIIRPAALVAAPQFTKAELEELANRFTSPGSIYLADILKTIMKHTTLEPFYVILSETNHLLEWGHHFAYYPSKKHTISYLNKQVIIAFQQLRECRLLCGWHSRLLPLQFESYEEEYDRKI